MTLFLYVISIGLMILLPVGLAALIRRRLAVPWWLFCVGMLTFVGSQIYHLPLNDWLTDLGLIGEVSMDAPDLLVTAIILGLSAGLSESAARAAGYWLLFRRRQAQNRADALMVGLGHGGIEAMFFGGVLTAVSVTSLLALQNGDLAALNLSGAEMAALTRQLALFSGSPALAFLPLLERLLAMILHVVLSLLIWRAFKERNPAYFVAGALYHALVDGTAVYASQFIENVWALEGVVALLAVPGLVYLWRMWPDGPVRAARPWADEWALFLTAVRKELMQLWRAKRVLVVTAVFLLFGLASPLVAKFTPELLKSIEGAEQLADLIPTPTQADSLAQYVKNITQFGFIIAILLGMGSVAGERQRGTAAMVLSKPLPRWAFVLSKFTAQSLVYAAAFLLAGLAAFYYTSILFEPFRLGPFLLGNGLLLVWLWVFTAVTLLGSALGKGIGGAAGIALAGSVLLLMAGALPQWGQLAPSGLVAWASQLGLGGPVAANGGALAANFMLIVLLLVTAVALFEQTEI